MSVQETVSLPVIKGHHPIVGSGDCITTSNQGPPPLCQFRGLYHYQQSRATTPVSVQGAVSLPAIKGHHPSVGSGDCITTSNQGPRPLYGFWGLYHYQQPRATTSVRIQGTVLVITGEHQCGGSRRKLHFLWWEPFPKTNSDANHTCKYFPTLGVIWPKMHTTRQNELPVQKLPDSGNFKMRADGFKGTNSYEILAVKYQYSFLAAAERSRGNWHGQPSF